MICTTLCSENTPVEVPTNNMPLLPGVWIGGGGGGAQELSFVITEGAVASEVLWAYTPTELRIFPLNLEGSTGSVQAAPEITTTLNLRIDGVVVGTIDIVNNVVDFTSIGFELAPGQTLRLYATEDEAFTSIAVSLLTTQE